MGLLTLAALWSFSPASAAGSNLSAASSLYGLRCAAWSFKVATSGTVVVSTVVADGAILRSYWCWLAGIGSGAILFLFDVFGRLHPNTRHSLVL
jgi:hypothetical protein